MASENRPYFYLLGVVGAFCGLALALGVDGDSTPHNLLWSAGFSEAFWAGDWFPRWLPTLNAGCGAPVFFYYPPLPFFLAALAPGIPYSVLYAPVAMAAALAFAAWMRAWLSPRDAAIAGAIYALMPYPWIDIFLRDAYSEFFSFLWIPLLLRSATEAAAGRWRSALWFAPIYALLILSSLHGALIGSLLVLAYGLFLSRKPAYLAGMAAMAMLGIGLAGFYLLPIVEGFRYVALGHDSAMFSDWFDYTKRFAFTGQVFDSFVFIGVGIAAALAATILWVAPRRDGFVFFWIAVLLVSLWLMTPLAAFTPTLFPPLKVLQFPWRLSIISTLAAAAAAGYALASLEGPRARTARITILVGLGLLSAGVVALSRDQETRQHPTLMARGIAPYPNEYLPVTTSETWLNDNGCNAQTRPLGGRRFETTTLSPRMRGSQTKHSARDEARDPRIRGDDKTSTIGQFYFPGFRAYDPQGLEIPLTADSNGLMTADLPPGTHRITLVLTYWTSEKIGLALSAICALILTCVWWRYSKISSPRRGEAGRGASLLYRKRMPPP